jgi:Mrp family chromosome partitioning ATPase
VNRSWASTAEGTSVTFVPLQNPPAPVFPGVVDFSNLPVLEHIVQERGRSLVDLARRIQRVGPAAGGTVALVSGCRRFAGTTTVTLALAAMAAGERSVLVLDGHLQQPSLARILDLRPTFSWDDALRGRIDLEDAMHPLGPIGALSLLPLRQPILFPDDLLSHPGLAGWLARLRREFRLIVVDGGPAGECGWGWAPWVDSAIVVCDSTRSAADEWARAWDRLEEGGTNVLGIVETFG